MSIIEQLQEVVKEQERVNLGYQMPTRAWALYEYLKDRCVGVNNAKSAEDIVEYLKAQYPHIYNDEYDTRQLRHDIRKIRTTLPRRIGSSSKGYWLMTSDDEIKGTSMMMKQFVSLVETLTQQGINPSLLHRIVGAFAKKQGREVDNQLTIKITEHLREVIHTLSDDLIGE
jgi:hypothetical protein